MKNHHILLKTLLVSAIVLSISSITLKACPFLSSNNVNVHASTNYRIHSAENWNDALIGYKSPIWNEPRTSSARIIGNTGRLERNDMLVHPYEVAYGNTGSYVEILRQGNNIGWVDKDTLIDPIEYRLPYRYTSQFWPSAADDACEAAALKMALSSKGKATHVSLARMVRHIRRSRDPHKGYTSDPWRWGSSATIYPDALSRVARKYGVRAHQIRYKNATASTLARYIKHGDPVVFEGSHDMSGYKSDHVLSLLGYKPGYFYYADPESRRYGHQQHGWVRINRFMRIFSSRKHGRRSMVVFY